ncbi:DUF6479 family protein [Streptomyces sp. OfavH-34-F]|uniref:DUF6479 family protein n=1 Tax=Streptomyces sp. OfavH-34-F TaxID=2917760 RepID=UPI001EF31DC5|nr:DUF6479 family protein [Streptomyces sp. OfavH-34-F]MCG7524712.1 DUF6479 family protein [Streptomyces sp. OfavH-34-F]
MDVSDGALNSLAVTLADGRGATGVVLGVIGVLLVLLLIGAFILGKRRQDQELPPPRPDEQPVGPGRRTHEEQPNVHGDDRFPPDGRGLSPYELGEHGNEPIRHEDDDKRD